MQFSFVIQVLSVFSVHRYSIADQAIKWRMVATDKTAKNSRRAVFGGTDTGTHQARADQKQQVLGVRIASTDFYQSIRRRVFDQRQSYSETSWMDANLRTSNTHTL
jgi:hypothetical protein